MDDILSFTKNILIILLLTALALITYVTGIETETHYSVGESLNNDLIAVYSVDRGFDELNQVYAKGEGIKEDDINKDSMVSYDDIETIASNEHIKDIYIIDLEYIFTVADSIYEDDGNVYTLSFPNDILENFSEIINYFDFRIENIEGHFPVDSENEIAISKNLLIDNYGYTESNVEYAISDTIEYEGNEYEIVGFYYYDQIIISYEEGINHGMYKYNSEDYEEFKNRNTDYLIENEFVHTDIIDSFVIRTEPGKEATVLNQTLLQYGANNYYSSYYDMVWSKEHNSVLIKDLYIANITYSGITMISIGITLLIVAVYNRDSMDKIRDTYRSKNKPILFYVGTSHIKYILMLILSLTINILTNNLHHVVDNMIYLSVIIMSIPLISFDIVMVKKIAK